MACSLSSSQDESHIKFNLLKQVELFGFFKRGGLTLLVTLGGNTQGPQRHLCVRSVPRSLSRCPVALTQAKPLRGEVCYGSSMAKVDV